MIINFSSPPQLTSGATTKAVPLDEDLIRTFLILGLEAFHTLGPPLRAKLLATALPCSDTWPSAPGFPTWHLIKMPHSLNNSRWFSIRKLMCIQEVSLIQASCAQWRAGGYESNELEVLQTVEDLQWGMNLGYALLGPLATWKKIWRPGRLAEILYLGLWDPEGSKGSKYYLWN